jgi:hypothetical protein
MWCTNSDVPTWVKISMLYFWAVMPCRLVCRYSVLEASILRATTNLPNSVAPESEGSSPYSQEPAPVPIMSQLDPLYTPPANLHKIHSDPILSSTPWSFKWPLSFWLSHQNLVHIPLLSHACHMFHSPHSP